MERNIIITADGSHTIEVPAMHATYHSVHGAIQESRHVFIEAGLIALLSNNSSPGNESGHDPIHVLEMGLGTGLNALLTMAEGASRGVDVVYTALEKFPLEATAAFALNYCEKLVLPHLKPAFEAMHTCQWETIQQIAPGFAFEKKMSDPLSVNTDRKFHLVYYDAFAPTAQPELWTVEVFDRLYDLMLPGGMLVTYCSKSDVRRAMIAAGFRVEKLPGPLRKREMLRAMK